MKKKYRDRLRKRLTLNMISFVGQNKSNDYIIGYESGYEECLRNVESYLKEAELYVNNFFIFF